MIERGELSGAARCPVVRVSGEAAREHRLDVVAVEEPLEIRIDGNSVATTMRTPGRDADLALGFLFAEGIIAGPDEVGRAVQCGRDEKGCSNVIEVRSAAGKRIDMERVLAGRRWSTTSSACGVCGRRTIDDLLTRMSRLAPGVTLSARDVVEAMEQLAASQPLFARTGGLHAAAILDETRAVAASAEDVGRHNAVDKAVGALLWSGRIGAAASGPPLALLAVSGRSSFEIVQKAAVAGIPCVASVSAPSSLAVELARAAGMLLVGFVRGSGFNVYSGESRLSDDPRRDGCGGRQCATDG